MEYLSIVTSIHHLLFATMASRIKLLLAFAFLLSAVEVGSSHSSPYLQVYPPVDETDERTPLYFALALSFGGEYKSIEALLGVQIALDYINSEPSILPGYTLHYTLTDSQVEIASFIANRAGYNEHSSCRAYDNHAQQVAIASVCACICYAPLCQKLS